jgi:hypothetical protein
MNDLEKIKLKLKKLFAMSRSPNANEAALALEMAQKLMTEHGIKRNEVGEFEVIKDWFKGKGNEKPPKYELCLSGAIAKAFGCEAAYGWHKTNKTKYGYYTGWYGHTFVGLEHRVQIACFITTVLFRKLKKARSDYVKKLTRVRSKTNKIKRADEFCLGWVITVIDKLNQFTNTPAEQNAIDDYAATLGWSDKLKTIDRKPIKAGMNDYHNGRRAGSGVEIQNGVGGNKSGALLLEAAV